MLEEKPKTIDFEAIQNLFALNFTVEAIDNYLQEYNINNTISGLLNPKNISDNDYDLLKMFIKKLFTHEHVFKQFLVENSGNDTLMAFVTHNKEDIREIITLAILKNAFYIYEQLVIALEQKNRKLFEDYLSVLFF